MTRKGPAPDWPLFSKYLGVEEPGGQKAGPPGSPITHGPSLKV